MLGADALELCKDFWERLAKLEMAHAKNIEELCASRQAKLTKLFSHASCEPVPYVVARCCVASRCVAPRVPP